MTPIVSPTTTDRILRTVGLTAMFAVFSCWFLYDGLVGYPNENLKKAVESLDPVPEELPPINPGITKATTADFTGNLKPKQLSRADITSQLGRPGWESLDQSEIRYFGPGGVLRISMSGDGAQDGEYIPGHNDDIELVWQKLLSAVMLPIALGMILQLIRVLTTKVVLTDQALILRARPPIPFEAMKAIDAGKLQKSGSLDLHYSYNQKQKKVRLDDYVIRDFRPIVTEICIRCNFENPLPPPKTKPDSAQAGNGT